MKELTSYNRVAGYLNKIFDLLNRDAPPDIMGFGTRVE